MSRIYWHIQMHLPEGREGGITINPKDMLMEEQPIIGTGEWEDIQCERFKGLGDSPLKIGDVILVREGKKALALCQVTGNNFTDSNLTKKYVNVNFRHVKVLDWYNGKEEFSQPQSTLQRLVNITEAWKFINSWYKEYLIMEHINKGIELLNLKGQIILQGPPGTGKTYTAKDIAEKIIFGSVSQDKKRQKENLENSGQFKLVQFHPSYSYEDFVRGIVAKSAEGEVEYETVDKVFGEFARRANKNFIDSQRPKQEVSYEEWVKANYKEFLDAIQKELDKSPKFELNTTAYVFQVESDAVRYNGDNWPHPYGLRMKSADIIKLYLAKAKTRQDVINASGVSSLARDHATYFKIMLEKFYEFMKDKKNPEAQDDEVEQKKYVLVIDEMNRANLSSVLGELIYALEYRNQAVETMYEIDGDNSLIIPSNFFVIGTMNTADRSVGHIDYAIRRRFAFMNIPPNDVVITNTKAQGLFQQVKRLFVEGKLAPEFEEKDVLIGHSYFLSKHDAELQAKLEYEIKPILREYIKDGILLPETNAEIENLNV